MPGLQSNHLHGLTPRVEALGTRIARLQALQEKLRSDLAARKLEVEALSLTVEKTTKVEALFRKLLDVMVVKQMQAFDVVITEGLQTIFYDQDLHFESEISPKYNKISIDFYLRQGAADDLIPIRGRPLDSFGGGPTCLASFVLRVLALRRLKKFPLLAMDETLNAVSDDYVDGTGRFLKTLAQEIGFDLLLVTHKPAFLDHADIAYHGRDDSKDGRNRLQIRAS